MDQLDAQGVHKSELLTTSASKDAQPRAPAERGTPATRRSSGETWQHISEKLQLKYVYWILLITSLISPGLDCWSMNVLVIDACTFSPFILQALAGHILHNVCW